MSESFFKWQANFGLTQVWSNTGVFKRTFAKFLRTPPVTASIWVSVLIFTRHKILSFDRFNFVLRSLVPQLCKSLVYLLK